MKRCFILFSLCLVLFSLAANIAAGVFAYDDNIEMFEKEGKTVGGEQGFDKEKILPYHVTCLSFLTGSHEQGNLHRASKLSSLALGTEINPPDFNLS